MLNEKKLLTMMLKNTYKNIKVIHNIALGSSGAVAAGGTSAVIQTDISSEIPDGYKLALPLMRGTASNNVLFWYFDWAGNRIDYRVRNVGSSSQTVSPTVNLVCIKEDSI